MNFSKIKIFTIAAIYLFVSSASASEVVSAPPDINSESYIVTDFDTGTVLFSKNENEILSPASLTKMMTIYAVFKSMKKGIITKDTIVKVSKNAVLTAQKTNSSKTFLEINDMVPIVEVIKGVTVQSGNDAAIALAETVSGSEENFSHLMNSFANELGMKNSQFKNASGLPAKDHYTTAKDLSLLLAAMIREFPEEYKYYFSLKSYEYNNISQNSRNKLLFSDNFVEGGKTGWHNLAKYCYMASFNNNGRRLIVVTLKSPTGNGRFSDALSLSNYAYQFYSNFHFTEKNKPLNVFNEIPIFSGKENTVSVVADDDYALTLPTKDKSKLEVKVYFNPDLEAPISVGDNVGYLEVRLGDDVLKIVHLIANKNIERDDFKYYSNKIVRYLIN